jgi:hypothetical protein
MKNNENTFLSILLSYIEYICLYKVKKFFCRTQVQSTRPTSVQENDLLI